MPREKKNAISIPEWFETDSCTKANLSSVMPIRSSVGCGEIYELKSSVDHHIFNGLKSSMDGAEINGLEYSISYVKSFRMIQH